MDEFLARDPVLPSDSSPACPRYNEAQEQNVRDIKEHLEQDGYLTGLFTRLPAAKITEIKDFTPAAWAKAKEKMLPLAA